MNDYPSSDDLPKVQPYDSAVESGTASASEMSATGSAPGAAGDGPGASAEAPATAAAGSMALSITCHAPFSNMEGWQCLACGVDTLHLSIYVQWSELWNQQLFDLEVAKEKASGTVGLPMNGGRFLILPGGKPPSYRFHLQYPEFQLYLSISREPEGKTPNVYGSIGSKCLWLGSVGEAVALIVNEIVLLGGKVLSVKPSRCDLAADFRIPGGLSLDFLRSHRVPPHVKTSHHETGNRLETFYHGAKKSPIQLRLYDKGLEVERGGTKLWFRDIWKVDSLEDVWRVEFQIRRKFLKDCRINSIDDLVKSLGGMWEYLTDLWVTLRIPDDLNATRRTTHPGWLVVQQAASRFGEVRTLDRNCENDPASVDWYVSHCGGCLVSYAVRRRIGSLEAAIEEFRRDVLRYWGQRDFEEEYLVKSIKLGYSCESNEVPENSDAGDAQSEEGGISHD